MLTESMSTATPWKQEKFVIGAYLGTRMTGDREKDMAILKTFSEAGFDLMVGQQHCYCSELFDKKGMIFNPNAVSIRYMLKILADFNQGAERRRIGLLINDKEICGRKIPVNMPYSADSFKNYQNLPPESRDSMEGYNIIDEPDLARFRECLPAICSAIEIEKEKLIFVNLGDGGFPDVQVFFQNQDIFRLLARELAENGSIISFDNYHWLTTNKLPSKKISGKFFRLSEIVAEEAKRTNIPWWGMAVSVEHEKRRPDGSIRWGFRLYDPDNRNIKSEFGRFRFSAYANLIYGAKGVTWFTYDTLDYPLDNPDDIQTLIEMHGSYKYLEACLDCDGNKTLFYDYVKEVNEKMRKLGPVLMDLTWLTTVHGSPDNNYENVPNGSLPVVGGDTPVIASMPVDNTLAVGIFEGKDQNQYLIVMNKDIEEDKSYQIDLKNASKIYQFACDSGEWNLKALTGSGTFTADVEAGDIELFKIVAKQSDIAIIGS